MKREWELYELIEQWTLVPRELEMLRNKTGATRLGYAVCLKFFQQVFQFPEKPRDVPKVVLRHIAQQVDVPAEEFPNYFPPGRAAKYHRQQIREFCGFRGPTDQDAQALQDWLYQTILPQSHDPLFVEQMARERFQELRIEPLSPKQLQRVIRAALHQYEQAFCQGISSQLSAATCRRIDQLLLPETEENVLEGLPFQRLAAEPAGAGLLQLSAEVEKLKQIRQLGLPLNLFAGVSDKIVTVYRRRAATERLIELRRHPATVRYTLLSAFYWQRGQEITDNLVDILLQIIHKLTSKAEYRVTQQLTQESKWVESKTQILNRIARAALANPDGKVRDVIFPVVSPETLERLLQEGETKGVTYRQRVHWLTRRSYLHYYRRMLPQLLDALDFRSNNTSYQPIMEGLRLVKKYAQSRQRYFPPEEKLPLEQLLRGELRETLLETDAQGQETMERVNFELVVLNALRSGLRCKEIWVVGANRYRNPEQDLPADFEAQRATYSGFLSDEAQGAGQKSYSKAILVYLTYPKTAVLPGTETASRCRGVRQSASRADETGSEWTQRQPSRQYQGQTPDQAQRLDSGDPVNRPTRTSQSGATQDDPGPALAHDQSARCA